MVGETPATRRRDPKRKHFAPTSGLPTGRGPAEGRFIFKCVIVIAINKIPGPVAEWVELYIVSSSKGPRRIFPTPNVPFIPGAAQQCPWPQARRRRAGYVWRRASLEMRSIGWARLRKLQPPPLAAPAPPPLLPTASVFSFAEKRR